ncbi:glycerol-3-phosphate 1-O-acyltransferase PlsY [Acetobacterium wieringae]|jgi:glycerol-3-phosphate acyltransferase PlsY|uniref:Glycerol-3-phosphate acyltransferase n=1 Tax=Acetobacterium wieringae TaxID=52694 RepID=A0A1F2PG14_9FIRM|nr:MULTISPECIES: glycerol-3-phosphate 1-O-acyltransferase PlsY [Acetobacterium]MEA4804853.1 glycerol-3-phosphate 1-O-acyltransferase PlsY [Acetobacterium wieringae]OFV70290.1 putative glycerol-3-phosphate acyltransferase [Acetobacterium wieringae]TYC87123.1 glycerol-3-phosphate 1-O-acyltransferase PlsY [Acetobacterium wieringae]URN86056.1 glycerol-3-phosphate 1-O-acyltransferase PlsY [Acetobacterium wieringae]UYO64579.1 glycerol-3-phosphate 1-O-acyltransferase PlsY [Acetobacterium wieringae]
MSIIIGIVFVVAAYLIGNLNFAYILVKFLKNEDVRNYGSGNAGTTNVLRVMGKNVAIPVFLLDALKGTLVVLVGRYALNVDEVFLVLGGIAVVAGHNWPVFLQFRGGKGTATSLGVFLVYDWEVAVIAIMIGLIVLAIWKMVSLTSMVGMTMLPIFTLLFGRSVAEIVFAFVLCLFSIYQHRKNIGRIIQGKESKLGQKVKMKN